MNDKASYWLEMAEYDLDTAGVMLETKRYLYVGFMCHQSVEKALKAAIANSGDDVAPPKTHSLLKLARLAGLYDDWSEEQRDFIDLLDPLNVQARYPAYKDKLAAALSPQICKDIFATTREMFTWIKMRL